MPSPTLKRDASADLVAQVQRIEDQSDKWSDSLALAGFTHDVATWGVLTQIIDVIEQYITKYGHGSQEQRETMMNLGRAGSLLFDWLRKDNLPDHGSWPRWTQALADATREAVFAAHNYEIFVSCFSAWHKDRMAVEILSPTRLRFSVPPSQTDRRFRAHQQGARIPGWPSTPDNPVDKSFVNDADVNELLSQLWGRVTLEGALAMRYPDDSELLSALRDIYEVWLQPMFRRDPQLDLGGYHLGAFR